MRKIYICHPFSGEIEENIRSVQDICKQVFTAGDFPIAPQIYLSQFIDEKTNREQALSLCLDMLKGCDCMNVYGGRISDGMALELNFCQSNGIPIVFVDSGES